MNSISTTSKWLKWLDDTQQQEVAAAKFKEKAEEERKAKEAYERQTLQGEMEREEAKQHAAIAQETKETRRQQYRTAQYDRDRLQNALDAKIRQLQVSPSIHVRSTDNANWERFLTIMTQREELRSFIASNFSEALCFFGSPWLKGFGVLISMALGFLYVLSALGLDAIGDSAVLTVGITIVAVMAVDILAFLLMKGLLTSLQHFFQDNAKAYLTILASIITITGVGGMVVFIVNVFQRLTEAGI